MPDKTQPDLRSGGYPTSCRVLIVDDDPLCLEEYTELVESLGYDCSVAPDAAYALRLIAGDSAIGIVVADLRMPGMDGLTLLDELAHRFMPTRPLVAIVVTGNSTLETAVSAMRSSAADFLTKPVSLDGMSGALRRAALRWARAVAHFKLLALTPPPEDGESSPPELPSGGPPRTPTTEELQAFAARLMQHRQRRSKFFDPQILSGPAWDILLDLAVAGLKGEMVPTSSACASTQVPLSTALRHVNQLVEVGLVRRELDPGDRRRTLLQLEPHALELMSRYLASSWDWVDTKPS